MIGDCAQLVDRYYECADKGKIDQSDKQGGVTGTQIGHQGCKSPRCRQHRGDEEQQDVGRRELVVDDKPVDEPGQHTHNRDEREYLRNAEREEEKA